MGKEVYNNFYILFKNIYILKFSVKDVRIYKESLITKSHGKNILIYSRKTHSLCYS